jgi:mono/diheme cytochrome c family protein
LGDVERTAASIDWRNLHTLWSAMSNRRWLFNLRTIPRVALAAAACAASNAAVAQTGNPANGELLYKERINFPVSGLTNCEDCHGPAYLFQRASTAAAISSAISNPLTGMSPYAFLTAQQRADIAAYVATALPPPPPPPFAPAPPPPSAPTPAATPNPVLFGTTQVGSTSPTIGVLFTNNSTVTINFASPPINAVGGATSEFLAALPPSGTAMCGASLAPGTSCSFGVQFRPQTSGARSATWVVSFTGGVAAATLMLDGMATATSAPAPAPAPPPASPSPAPAPSAANAPTSGGGGATGGLVLGALALLAALRRRSIAGA